MGAARCCSLRGGTIPGTPSTARTMLLGTSLSCLVRSLRDVFQSHFFSLHMATPAAVNRFNSATNSGSGSVLKLKHVLPCICFFNAGETPLASAGIFREYRFQYGEHDGKRCHRLAAFLRPAPFSGLVGW